MCPRATQLISNNAEIQARGEVKCGRGQRTRERKAGDEGLSFLFPTGSENCVQLQENNHTPTWNLLRLRDALCGHPLIH